MKNITLIQASLWGIFLVYYCLSKFFAGYQGYSHAYLIQVALIVAVTAVLPYYLSRWLGGKLESAKVWLYLVAPSVLAMSGYGAFYVLFIAPNFPDVAAFQVVIRGLLPGAVISAILMLPMVVGRFQARNDALANQG